MKREIEPEILEIILDANKYTFCPESVINCEYLDRSIIIIGTVFDRFSCSNPKAQDIPELKIVTLSVCPLLKIIKNYE